MRLALFNGSNAVYHRARSGILLLGIAAAFLLACPQSARAQITTGSACTGSKYLAFDNANAGFIWVCNGTTQVQTLTFATSGAVTLGLAGTTLGSLAFAGNTSGTVTVQPAAAAGAWTMTLPTSGGTSGYVLQTDGTGITSWISNAGTASTALSGITAATGSQAGIANGNNTIVWKWDALTSGSAMKFSTSGTTATTGQTLLTLSSNGTNTTSGQTTYGEQISNTHANATSGTNVGLSVSASGATTANYAAVFPAGWVGVGLTNPGNLFEVYDLETGTSGTLVSTTAQQSAQATANSSGQYTALNVFDSVDNNFNYTNAIFGIQEQVAQNGTGTVTAATGGQYQVLNTSTGFITNGTAGLFSVNNSSSGSVTTAIGVNVSQVKGATTGTGIRISGVTGATTNYDVYANDAGATNYFAGNVGIGATGPSQLLQVTKDATWAGSGNEGQIGVTGASNANKRLNLGLDTTSNFGFISAGILGSTWSPLILNGSGGSVGIGSTAPTQTLDVGGIAIANSYYFHDAASETMTAAHGIQLNGDTSHPIQIPHSLLIGYTASGGTYTDSTLLVNGNVGIGTTSPNTNLDLGSGFMEWGGQSRVTSTFSKTSNATLSAITGLSATLTAGKTYYFDVILYTTSGASGGIQADLNGGNATATSIIGDGIYFSGGGLTQTRISALSTNVCNTFNATATCHITGTITVNAAGTFIPRFAQASSNATASTVAIGSIMIVQQIN